MSEETDQAVADAERAREERALAQEALRCRLSVLRNLDKPDRGTRMALDLMGVPVDLATRDHLLNAELIRQQLLTMTADASTFLAPADMCAMMNARPSEDSDGPTVAMSYPGETMNVRDMLSPQGMIFFEDPIVDPTGQYDLFPIRALSWSVAKEGDPAIEYLDPPPGAMMLTLIGYTDTRVLPSAIPDPRTGRLDLSKPMTPQELQERPRISPVVPVVWQVGVKGGGFIVEEEQQSGTSLRLPYIKTLLAWWAIMRQRLADRRDVVVKKHPKEMQRALRRRPNLNSDMHLIRLRRSRRYQYTEYRGSNRRDWSHAWWVRAYWREDWRATRRGEESFQLVSAHEKGPWDKPVREVERVWLPPLPHVSER